MSQYLNPHDVLRDNIKAKGKHPKAPLQSTASVQQAWRHYIEYTAKAWTAYGSYHRHNNQTHHARYEAYDDLALEWFGVLDAWIKALPREMK